MLSRRIVWLYAILIAFGLACSAQSESDFSSGSVDGFRVAQLSDAGFAQAAIDSLLADIEADVYPNTHALLVFSDDALVLEEYFSGSDERWGEFIAYRDLGPDSLHDLRSVSKSVTSMLLGIALENEIAQEIARPITDFFPEQTLADTHEGITLHHVLTMTAGLRWNEMSVPYTDSNNDEIRLYSAPNPSEYVLSQSLVSSPGDVWYYSGGLSQVLADAVFNLTGQTIDDYARTELFAPLGITEFEWLGPGTWIPENPAAMSGLRLTARDLTKLGVLYLNGGQWRGKQIVPEEWVRESMKRHVSEAGDWSEGGIWGYGYQWWVGQLPSGEEVVAGLGNGNQRLFILPSERLVVTVFAGEYNKFEGHSERILDRILSARR